MVRKMPTGKVAWVLLVFCVLLGGGGSGVWAEDDPGVQLVVVLDSVNAPGDSQMNGLLPQAAGLLVHLLGDQDYLGLVTPGEPEGVFLPPARLSPEHRKQALESLSRFAPDPDQRRIDEMMQQALSAFQPQGPKRRVLFWLAGSGGVWEDQQGEDKPPQIEKIASQARSAGVKIFAALRAPAPAWQTLTASTGGRVWEITTVSDLQVPCLKLYQYLTRPQEAPLNRSQVRLDKWVKQAVMVLTRSDPQKGVILTSPGKARLTKRTRAKNVRWVAGRSCDLITLTRPRPGVWGLTGTRSEVCKVFLSTELILSAAHTPREVAQDETLVVSAVLRQKGAPADSKLLEGTKFSAELQLHDRLLTTDLKAPPPDRSLELPTGTRTGRFPPVQQEGQGTLRIMARGKDFSRLKELPLTITKPWYRVTSQDGKEAQDELPLHFKPNPGRHPEQVEGVLTLRSARGSLRGIFLNPAPGAEIIVDRSPGSDDFCQADLHLDGTAPDGHPLAITLGPVRLQSLQSGADDSAQLPVPSDFQEEVQVETPSSLSQKFMAPWVWLALCSAGGGVLLISAFLLWRLRGEAEEFEGEEDYGGSAPTNILRLKAQVESLVKEKGELEVALKEKSKQFNQLQAEKAELQADLERSQQKAHENFQALQDLEKKLQETEEEAKRVKQEYMALYARNQQEKETLKKN
jgi:hypothetical protein